MTVVMPGYSVAVCGGGLNSNSFRFVSVLHITKDHVLVRIEGILNCIPFSSIPVPVCTDERLCEWRLSY